MAHDVFISYSSKDQPIADAVCHALESKQIRCWYAARDIRGGSSWSRAIMKAIIDSRVMIYIWTSNSGTSIDVIREVEHAFRKGLVVIPFRLEVIPANDDLEYYLEHVHWLNALPPPFEDHLPRLVSHVQANLPRGQAEHSEKGFERKDHDAQLRQEAIFIDAQKAARVKEEEEKHRRAEEEARFRVEAETLKRAAEELARKRLAAEASQKEAGRESADPRPSIAPESGGAPSRRRSYDAELPVHIVNEDERRMHLDARRFARLLTSEIKLYNEPKLAEGRARRDVYGCLREEIDNSRKMYDKRVKPEVASKYDYFHYEVINTLAEGDPKLLGASYPWPLAVSQAKNPKRETLKVVMMLCPKCGRAFPDKQQKFCTFDGGVLQPSS